jgi:integrating conjugative element protein (TIGR03755 family)
MRYFLPCRLFSLLVTGILCTLHPVLADNPIPESHGAIADTLYYQIGGGSVLSPAASRRNTQLINVGIGWRSDLMCGNFDIDTTVKNQLNGVTDGFQDLMGEVIENATSAVASLPAMVIQRANPQLYDLLTNGVLQGRLDFDKSQLSCKNMAQKMTDYAYNSAWTQAAQAENYQGIVAGEPDAVRAEQEAAKEAAKNGKRWVGGERRGGQGQKPIKVITDTTTAGYNILNNRSTTDSSPLSGDSCEGEVCRLWGSPDEAAKWMTRVIGEQNINVSPENDESGSGEDRSGAQAGTGLTPLIEEEQEKIAEVLGELVNGSLPPTSENLAKASGGQLQLTRGVVVALRDDPDAAVLGERLTGEMALARVMEQTLTARRTLLAGMREPNIAGEKEAQTQLGQATTQLDRELDQLRLELEMRRMLADNASTTILQRKIQRDATRGQAIGVEDDGEARTSELKQDQMKE